LQVAKSKIRSANCGTKTNHAKGVKKKPKKALRSRAKKRKSPLLPVAVNNIVRL